MLLWARRSSSLGRSLSVTADNTHTDILSSCRAVPEAGWSGATKARCSYFARIQDSLSSLSKTDTHKNTEDLERGWVKYKYDLFKKQTRRGVASRGPAQQHKQNQWIWMWNPPCCMRSGFGSPLCAALPDTIGHVVSNGSQDLCEFSRPVVQVQGADTGQVSPQVPMYPRTLDTNQRT